MVLCGVRDVAPLETMPVLYLNLSLLIRHNLLPDKYPAHLLYNNEPNCEDNPPHSHTIPIYLSAPGSVSLQLYVLTKCPAVSANCSLCFILLPDNPISKGTREPLLQLFYLFVFLISAVTYTQHIINPLHPCKLQRKNLFRDAALIFYRQSVLKIVLA